MKNITKLTFIAAAFAAIGTSAACADDQMRAAMRSAQNERSHSHFAQRLHSKDQRGLYVPNNNVTTIAAYRDRQGVGPRDAGQTGNREARFGWRMTSRGYTGFYMPAD